MPHFVPLISPLRSGREEGLVIDTGGSKTPGTPVALNHPTSPLADRQLWETRLTGETDGDRHNFVFIINKDSGLALTVPNEPRFDIGAAVVQFGLDGGENQKWLQFPPENQPPNQLPLFIFSNMYSACVLSVKIPSPNDQLRGAPIIQSQEEDSANQLWKITF